jgi:hypothetical protein
MDIDDMVEKVAMDFATKDALKKYLRDHPDADKSKHKVKKKTDPKQPKEPKREDDPGVDNKHPDKPDLPEKIW